jgi:hypothetical protein
MKTGASTARRTKGVGAILLILGTVVLLFRPYVVANHPNRVIQSGETFVPGIAGYAKPSIAYYLLWTVNYLSGITFIPAIAVVVGANSMITGKMRSSKPSRATLVVPLAAISPALLTYLPSRCNPPYPPCNRTPDYVFEAVIWTLGSPSSMYVAASLRFVIGVSSYRNETQWVRGSLAGILLLGAVYSFVNGFFDGMVLLWALVVASIGLVLYGVGYATAVPPKDGTGESEPPDIAGRVA